MPLTDNQLQNMRESRRLSQTQLAHTEEALQAVRAQQERLRTFIAVNAEMQKEQKHLYEVNKQQASLLSDQQALERFETFEAVNGRFQRIRTLSQELADLRASHTAISTPYSEAHRHAEEAERSLTLEKDKLQETYNNVMQAARTMAEAERQSTLAADAQASADIFNESTGNLRQRLERLKKQRQEVATASELKQQQLTELQTQRQTLEAYKSLIHERGVLSQLDEMQNVGELRDKLTQQLRTATQRQNEHNERLSRLFYENEKLKDNINARQEELDSHRRSIAGQDSYNLQRRALELRSRKLLLGTAFSLWRNIASGFDRIEQKEQALTAMRLRCEHLNRQIDTLTEDIRRQQQQLELRTYQWTISKSQNVIELRGDLQEGAPCTVCGATHHPWHSETISEQKTLIATLKTDCDNLSTDIRIKQQNLQEAQKELTTTLGKIEAETENLQMLIMRQQDDTAEWQHYVHLDRSLADCSRSTNREARTAIMRQLIEKTSVDADEAEKELKTFTFHLDAISSIGLEVQQLQHEAGELAIRLNEENTACQVMASEVERLSQQMSSANDDYSRRFKALENVVSLPEWFREWKASPEGLKLRIQQMTEQWHTLEISILAVKDEIESLSAQDEFLQQCIQQTTLDLTQLEARHTQAKELMSKSIDTLNKLIPISDGKTLFAQAQDKLKEQLSIMENAEQTYAELLQEDIHFQTLSTHIQQSIHSVEERVADERRELDVWMRHYNANHPPVQFAELERLLSDGREWSSIRQKVRENIIEQAVTQSRVDRLRAQIIALQADGLRPISGDGENEQEQLRTQQEELEQRRRATQQQIARYDAILDSRDST